MAARSFSRVQALNHSMKIIAGSFSVTAASNTTTKLQGLGFSPAHVGEGIYAIDLEDAYPHLIAAIVQTKKASAGDLNAQIKSYSVDEELYASKEVQDLTYTSRVSGRAANAYTIEYTAADAATAVLNLTADITLTKAVVGSANNDRTFTIQVLAAAPNDDDEVLVTFSGDEDDIVCTVTPNDGTNNSATPVDLTTAELRELISTGAVVGKTITLTDASSLRALQTATGGGATALANGGEGDGVSATFADGTGIAEGAEVSVSGTDITVLIDDGVTDADTILEAVEASAAASYLVSVEVTGTGSDAQDAASAVPFTGGHNKGLIVENLAGASPTDADCEVHFQLYLLNSTGT